MRAEGALRNNQQQAKPVSAPANSDPAESVELTTSHEVRGTSIAFDPAASASKSRTIAELGKFAERAEENRDRMQQRMQSVTIRCDESPLPQGEGVAFARAEPITV
jgi:hypothetical protein